MYIKTLYFNFKTQLIKILIIFLELEPSFPYRDITIRRGVDMKEHYELQSEIGR